MQDLSILGNLPLNHVCRALLLDLDGAAFNRRFAQFRRECELVSLASKAVDDKNFLLATGTVGVDVGGRVNQVEASNIVVGDLLD